MPVLLLLRLTATLAVVNLLVQFVSAGQLLAGEQREVHAVSAIVLHVLTGLVMIAAVLHRRAVRGPVWPSALAAIVFIVTFVQAWTGDHAGLAVHVPGALITTVGVVWLAAWSWTPSAAHAAGHRSRV